MDTKERLPPLPEDVENTLYLWRGRPLSPANEKEDTAVKLAIRRALLAEREEIVQQIARQMVEAALTADASLTATDTLGEAISKIRARPLEEVP